jgi:hypothetical protein
MVRWLTGGEDAAAKPKAPVHYFEDIHTGPVGLLFSIATRTFYAIFFPSP